MGIHRNVIGFGTAGLGPVGGRLLESQWGEDASLATRGLRRGVCATVASSAGAINSANAVQERRGRNTWRPLEGPGSTLGRIAVRRQDPTAEMLSGPGKKVPGVSPKIAALSESWSSGQEGPRKTGSSSPHVNSVDRDTNMSLLAVDDPEPRIRGRKKRKPRKTSPSTRKQFKTFEQELREEALLKHSEEIELAHDIQLLVAAEKAKEKLAKDLDRTPTMTEWADVLEISPADLQRRIQVGLVSKKRLVRANLRLVNDLVNKSKFPASMVNPQDLLQEGCIGLVRAAEKFDGTKGFRFSTYATWWVRANIIRGIDTNSRLIRLPVRVKETFNKIKNKRTQLAKDLKREPTEEEVAEATKMTVAKMRLIVETYGHRAASLDEVTNNSSGEETFNRTLGDSLTASGDIEASIVEKHLRRDLDRVLKEHLKPRERVALRLRFGLENGQPLSLREVGVLMELSTERVRQIIRLAMGKLRDPSVQSALKEYLSEV